MLKAAARRDLDPAQAQDPVPPYPSRWRCSPDEEVDDVQKVLRFHREGLKLESAKLTDLVRAHRIEIDKDTTTLIGSAGASEQVEVRVAQIRQAIEEATSD